MSDAQTLVGTAKVYTYNQATVVKNGIKHRPTTPTTPAPRPRRSSRPWASPGYMGDMKAVGERAGACEVVGQAEGDGGRARLFPATAARSRDA